MSALTNHGFIKYYRNFVEFSVTFKQYLKFKKKLLNKLQLNLSRIKTRLFLPFYQYPHDNFDQK